MNLREFRDNMYAARSSFESEANALKDTYLVLDRLHALYQSFDDQERELANQVIGEWALAADEGLRFDALHLIDVFRITALAPVLRALDVRLATSTAPSAPYERATVELILASLGGETS